MTISEFEQRVIAPLREKKRSLDGQRIALAYQDFVDMATLAEALERDSLMSRRDGDDHTIVARMQFTRFLVTILKALYMLADIYISTFLHEALGRPAGGMSIIKFLKRKDSPLRPAINSMLSVYCLVVYRNKVIAHQDIRRTYSYETDLSGSYRVAPLPGQLDIAKADVEKLKMLKEKYGYHIPGLVTEENLFVMLRLLFYGVPIGEVGDISKDRQAIDAIAECGGCPSMTKDEIIRAVDDFSSAMINAVSPL
jgi:hypothetical protein